MATKSFALGLALLCIVSIRIAAQSVDSGQHFDTPPPLVARDLVKRGVVLAGQDRVDEAIAAVKKAIVISPNYLEAHQAYLSLKIDFQGKVDEVISEYESLMAREPENPIYPAAMSMGLSGRVPTFPWLKKVAELAPESSWGHYANSYVILGRSLIARATYGIPKLERLMNRIGAWNLFLTSC